MAAIYIDADACYEVMGPNTLVDNPKLFVLTLVFLFFTAVYIYYCCRSPTSPLAQRIQGCLGGGQTATTSSGDSDFEINAARAGAPPLNGTIL